MFALIEIIGLFLILEEDQEYIYGEFEDDDDFMGDLDDCEFVLTWDDCCDPGCTT